MIVAGLLYTIFWFYTSGYFLPLYTLHVFAFIVYALIIMFFVQLKEERFSGNTRLLITVFVVSLLFMALNNYTSFQYNNNFFVFSEADAGTYHLYSLIMAQKSFGDAVNYILSQWQFDDLGAFLIVSTCYRLVESNLVVNFFYIIIGVFSAKVIFRICLNFMSRKYSFICVLSYSLSSFVVWFHSSGLKESFMCFLVLMFFDRYYLYMKNRIVVHLISSALFLLTLALFRPVLIIFGVGAVGLGTIMKRRKGLVGTFLIVIVFSGLVGLTSIIESSYSKFLGGGDFDRLLIAKEATGMVKGGVQFTYAVNLLAQLIGPLPTLSPDTKEMLSFFSPGLIYKTLLSVIFWFGVYYIFKLKVDLLYPLFFFIIFEMLSLLMILEGLELRISLPHFALIYIIAFWFMDQYDLKKSFVKLRSRRRIQALFSLSTVCIFVMILTWNIRENLL
jgi:hypothetical protein